MASEYLNKAIFYAGSDSFSIEPLKRLLSLKYKRIAVITKPPKKQGRGMQLKDNPLAEFASHHNVERLMPQSPNDNDFLAGLKERKPDALITCAYGKMMSDTLLGSFAIGNINVHPSLLPRWRGPSPIESAILEGDKKTGVSLMKMTEDLDAGPIYEQRSIQLTGENTKTLSNKLSLLAADMIEEFLPTFLGGNTALKQQDEGLVTHSKIIKKEDALIDWNESPEKIDKKIKAYYPWPIAHTYLGERYIRIWDSEVFIQEIPSLNHSPGKILDTKMEGIVVQCGASPGAIILKGVQPEGKKEMHASDFARGNKLEDRRFS